jgi:pimeloyl-ACP methyl ester carboxylesterase
MLSNEAVDRALDGMHDLSSPEQREASAHLRNGTVQAPADPNRLFGALARLHEFDPAKTPPGGFKPIADIDRLNWFFARDRQTYDVRPKLAHITAPTLVLTGRHEKIAPPFASEEIVKGIPHAQQVMFEQSGYRLVRKENAKFLQTVRDLIGRL